MPWGKDTDSHLGLIPTQPRASHSTQREKHLHGENGLALRVLIGKILLKIKQYRVTKEG